MWTEDYTKLLKISTQIQNKALRVLVYDLKNCDPGIEFWQQAEHAVEDYLAQVEVAHLLISGKPTKACREAWDLDTATRDELPISMLNLMEKHTDGL